jgi:hypothetical protein
MKKSVVILFIILVTLPIIGFSQKRISFGFKLSGTMNFVSSSFFRAPSPKQGFSIGALGEFKIVGPLAIRAEVLFANRGYKDDITFTDASGGVIKTDVVKVNTNYIELPVLVKLSFGKIAKPYFLIGGKGSLFVNGKVKYPDINIPNSTTGVSTFKYNANPYDYSAIGGFGLDFNLSKLSVFTELRYNHGFVAIDAFNTRFRTLEASAGVKF